MKAHIDFQLALAPNPCKNGWDLEVQSVVDFLKCKPHRTIAEIGEWTNLSNKQIAEVLRYLAKEEMLGRIQNKFYLILG